MAADMAIDTLEQAVFMIEAHLGIVTVFRAALKL